MDKRDFLGSALLAAGSTPASAQHAARTAPGPVLLTVAGRFGACPWALYHIEVIA